jgi:glycosyltransferase involved in cell wall biosynthesis
MRILHCIHNLQGGGAERQLQLLTNASAACGMHVGIFCADDTGREGFANSVTLFVGRRSQKFQVGYVADLHHAIQSFRPDIIHAWLPEVITIPALAIAGLSGIPVVFSYRWSMHWHRLLTVFEFLLAATFSSIIVSNHPICQDREPYRWLFRRKHGVVIPNGIPLRVSPKVEPTRSTRQREARILFAGRLTAIKNWACLLDAVALLPSDLPYRLSICGKGEDQSKILARATGLGIADRVDLRGFERDIHAIMQDSDILVLPSWSEGMSNVFFEALECQLPCVVSDIPAHREMVMAHGCARLFNPNSPQDLAHVIAEILLSADLQYQLKRAGVSALRHYGVKTMVERYLALYQTLLDPSQRKGNADYSRRRAEHSVSLNE